MTDTKLPQFRKNRLRTAAIGALECVEHLHEQLAALEGDVDDRELRAAFHALRGAESGLLTIQQMADRIGAER